MPDFTKCHLHVPHKLWADDQREQENYLAIERWCRDYLRRYIVHHSTRETPLLFPYKDWYETEEEAHNYQIMEQWVYLAVPASLGTAKVGFNRYDLHIPHKEWALDQGERGVLEMENYLEIERWAFRFLRVCLPTGSVS